jgi:small subunit ribosomal protein S1
MDQNLFNEELLAQYDYTLPTRGQRRTAIIISISKEGALLDVGDKRDGIVPAGDLARLSPEERDSLQPGDEVTAVVLRPFGREGEMVVSLSQGMQERDWKLATALLDSGEVVERRVISANRGGVLVAVHRLDGFVPNSQLDLLELRRDGASVEEAKERMVGQNIPTVVIEVDADRRRLILSQRAAMRRSRNQLLGEVAPGQVLTGVVRSLAPYGAFVDLGGLDGLIHVSELDWQHVSNPHQVLRVGQQVEVEVLNVDVERGRVGLSRKRRLAHPFEELASAVSEGDVVTGEVSHVASFGVFVNLEGGVQGLIHNSRLPGQGSGFSLRPGQPIQVRVLSVDRERQRIGLEPVLDRDEDELDDDAALDGPEAQAEAEAAAQEGSEVWLYDRPAQTDQEEAVGL